MSHAASKAPETKKKERHSPWRILGNSWFLIKYLFRYTPGAMVMAILNSVLNSLSTILRNVVFTYFVFEAIEQKRAFSEILAGTVLLVALNLIFTFVTSYIWNVIVLRSNHKLHKGMQSELYLKACALDQACYDDPEFYNDFIWAIRESDSRAQQLRDESRRLLQSVITVVGTAAALIAIDPFVGLLIFIFLPLSLLLKTVYNRIEVNKKEETNPLFRRIDYIKRVFYLATHAKEVRQGRISDHLREDYSTQTEKRIAVEKRYRGRQLALTLVMNLLTGVFFDMAITVYLVWRYFRDEGFSLGDFSAGINAMWSIYWNSNHIISSLAKFNEHSIYIEKFRRFIGYEPKVVSGEAPVACFEQLTLSDVSFSYGEGEKRKDALSHITMTLRRGEKVAFVGYNGAGKTTLTKLLMRLYDPTGGQILYNGRELREYDLEGYRDHIGAVFQDYKLFAATVAENVMGGPYEESMESAVLSALHSASFDDKLASLEQGIQTPITREFEEKGIELSGGESQKLAIARVFARPFDIIIMDEPSSALDPIAEYELNRSVAEDAKDKTVIFISHRLSTTRMADRIFMFEAGRIIEEGSHEALMALDGKYAEMFRVQAEKYKKK